MSQHDFPEFFKSLVRCLRWIGQDAEDAAQEAMGVLIEEGGWEQRSIQDNLCLGCKIARNWYLKQKRKNSRLVCLATISLKELAVDRPKCSNAEIKEALRSAFKSLKPKHAQALSLRHLGEYSVGEVAQLLGQPKPQISVWCSLAKNVLRGNETLRLLKEE